MPSDGVVSWGMTTVLLVAVLAGNAPIESQGAAQGHPPKQIASMPFNPLADPAKDLKAALAKAKKENKRVILDVGGEWCVWCHRLDAFLMEQPTVRALLEPSYVWMKVNFSQENKNEKFLAAYPKIQGYPHLFVLDAAGKLLHSQDTGLLEEGSGYSLEKVTTFLKAWAPKAK